MAKAVDERRHERLSLIDAALKRLDAGDYGYCAACDEEIPAKRLAIDPVIALHQMREVTLIMGTQYLSIQTHADIVSRSDN